MPLSDVTDESLWCRSEGHQFVHVTDVVIAGTRKNPREVERQMQCRTCGAPAKRRINPVVWGVSSRKIGRYPEGYLVKGEGRHTKSEVIEEMFRRMGR